MEKELKYNIGEQVWLMYNNKAICGTIESIFCAHFIDPVTCTDLVESEKYVVHYNGERLDSYEPKKLFDSKEKLIESFG